MREIKFRAIPNKDFMRNENQKNILNSIAYYTKGEFYDGTFIYGYLADGYIIGKTIEAGEEYFVPSYWIPVEKETIGQYTGLKDKNGKEIYEGDIVLYKFASYKDISRILYHEGVASFVMEAIKEDDNTSMARFKKGTIREFVAGRVNGYDYVKVIGNIYENPELLEEE